MNRLDKKNVEYGMALGEHERLRGPFSVPHWPIDTAAGDRQNGAVAG